MNEEQYLKEKELVAKHTEILSKEEIFWKQKSQEIWLLGDRNFIKNNNSTKNRRNINRITTIKNESIIILTKPDEIKNNFNVFYKNLLNNYDSSIFRHKPKWCLLLLH